MTKSSVAQNKSFQFAVQVVLVCREIQANKREYILTKQLMRSATSIGANIEEAQDAVSRKEFAQKLSVSLKEARESHYWIRLMLNCNLLDEPTSEKLICELDEILRILVSSIKTVKGG